MIAESVHHPLDWLDALSKEQCSGDLVNQFVHKCTEVDKKETAEKLVRYDNKNLYLQELLELSIRDIETFNDNSSSLLDYISKYPEALDHAIYRSELSSEVFAELLTSDFAGVPYVAALSYFKSTNEAPIELKDEWRSAILAGDQDRSLSNSSEYYLERIFENDHPLAIQWMEKHFNSISIYRQTIFDDFTCKVVRPLSEEERAELMQRIDTKNVSETMCVELVGSNKRLFKYWLSLQTRRHKQLAPLTNPENENWCDLLVIALDHDFEPIEIAKYIATPLPCVWSGSEADMWRERQSSFRKVPIQDESDGRITTTIRYVLKELDRRIEDAEKLEQLPELRL